MGAPAIYLLAYAMPHSRDSDLAGLLPRPRFLHLQRVKLMPGDLRRRMRHHFAAHMTIFFWQRAQDFISSIFHLSPFAFIAAYDSSPLIYVFADAASCAAHAMALRPISVYAAIFSRRCYACLIILIYNTTASAAGAHAASRAADIARTTTMMMRHLAPCRARLA